MGIIVPQQQRQEKEESDLEKLSRIAGLANAGVNIYSGVKDIGHKKDQMEMAKAKDARDIESQDLMKQKTQAELEKFQDMRRGTITKNDLLDKQKDYEVVPEGTKGAMGYGVRDGDGINQIFLRPKKSAESGAAGLEAVLKRQNIEKNNRELYGEEGKFKALPVDSQKQIGELSTKNANQKVIKNLMDQTMKTLNDPKVSEEQKITAGLSALKVINSPLGADAVGAEEAERMGAYLQQFSFTRPGSTFGRDLPRFTEQFKGATDRLAGSIKANQDEVDNLYGRSGKNQVAAEDENRRRLIEQAKSDENARKLAQQKLLERQAKQVGKK